MKKMNNKGFSLVELIVVIAIMAVLVGVLAPQFIKYVENSRRSTDVSSAESIRSAIQADMADQVGVFVGAKVTNQAVDASHLPSSIAEAPTMKATAYKGQNFHASWDPSKGTCDVKTSDNKYILTDPNGAAAYKNQQEPASSGSNAQKATVS